MLSDGRLLQLLFCLFSSWFLGGSLFALFVPCEGLPLPARPPAPQPRLAQPPSSHENGPPRPFCSSDRRRRRCCPRLDFPPLRASSLFSQKGGARALWVVAEGSRRPAASRPCVCVWYVCVCIPKETLLLPPSLLFLISLLPLCAWGRPRLARRPKRNMPAAREARSSF